MSTTEVVDVAPGPSGPLSGKALFRNLHTREFLGHKKKVRLFFIFLRAKVGANFYKSLEISKFGCSRLKFPTESSEFQ